MKSAVLLQPLPIPTQIWSDISMDFIEGLPLSNGHTVIMVIVHCLSKYAHLVPFKHPFTATTVAKAFVNNVIHLHGIPTSIVSDHDKVFISLFWQPLFQLEGARLCMTSSYHPQSDGQTEVVNRTLEQYLRCFAGDQPHKWLEWISWAEFSYNTTIHSSTKVTPFEAVYDVPTPNLLAYTPGTSRVQIVNDYLRDHDKILRDLCRNHLRAQDRKKSHANQKQHEVTFEVGNYVYLKLQPYRQSFVAFCRSLKLASRFFGPYQIIDKVGTVAYNLALLSSSQIHNVFHVSLLRRHLGPVTQATPQLPPTSVDSTILPQPKVVLDRHVILKGKYRPRKEVLIKWSGAPMEDATWENEWRFTKMYPHFILADKDS